MATITYEPYNSKYTGKQIDSAIDKVINPETGIPNEIRILSEKLDKATQDIIYAQEKGKAGGVATLDDSGLIPSKQLPSYVDDTIEGTLGTFPTPGERGKIYVDTETNMTYRWSGTTYINISNPIKFGEDADTAYPGNKGKQNRNDIEILKNKTTEYIRITLNDTTDYNQGGTASHSPSEIYEMVKSGKDVAAVATMSVMDENDSEVRAFLQVVNEEYALFTAPITGIAGTVEFYILPDKGINVIQYISAEKSDIENKPDFFIQDEEPIDAAVGDMWIDSSEEGGTGGDINGCNIKIGYDDEIDSYGLGEEIEIYKIEASSSDGTIENYFQPHVLICVPAYKYPMWIGFNTQYRITNNETSKREYYNVDGEAAGWTEWESCSTNVETTDEVSDGNELPVQSGAVKEYIDEVVGEVNTIITNIISEQKAVIAQQQSILAIQNNYIAMSDTTAIKKALEDLITEQEELIGGNM